MIVSVSMYPMTPAFASLTSFIVSKFPFVYVLNASFNFGV